MAKKWAEVQTSPEYQALAPEKKEVARQQYFQQVIAPQLPADKVDTARGQFDKETKTAAEEAPKEQSWGQAIKNVGEGALRLGTGAIGSVAGDVAGLGSLIGAAVGDAVTGEVGGSGIDPAAIREKVANLLTYQPSDPNSTTNKIIEAPGKFMAGAGEGLAQATGTTDVPILGDIARAAPMAAASLFGIRKPQTPALPAGAKTVARKEMTPEQLHTDAVDTLLKNDVRLTTEQRGTGALAKQSGSIGRAADTLLGKSRLAKQQLQDFTRAVFNKVGIKADNATPDAMAELKRSGQAKYQAAHARAPIPVDAQLATELQTIRSEAQLNPYVEKRFDAMLDHIQRNTNATPTGPIIAAEDATKIRTKLLQIQGGADSNLNAVAREVQDALDSAAERSATPAEAAAMREARKQHHFMKQIEDAINPEGGFVSPKKLLNVINRKRNKNEAVYGAGDQELVDLANAGAKVLPDAVGNSGTAARTMDVMKAAAAFAHPVTAAKTIGAVMGGRLLNEASAMRGTSSMNAAQAKMRATGTNPIAAAAQIGLVASTKETEEQKKRRLRAEALRSN